MEEPLSSVHATCFFAFESLVYALKQPMRDFQDDIRLTDIENEFDKYKIWAGNVGAAHSGKKYEISLDYRLREASFLKEQVLKLLLTLKERISTVDRLLNAKREQFEERIEESGSEVSTPSDLGMDQEEEGEEAEDSPWEISSDSSNGDGSVFGHQLTHQNPDEPLISHGSLLKATKRPGLNIGCSSISEIPRLVESIKFTISCLYRLPIRKPAPLDRIKDRTSLDSAAYQRFDVLYVKDKFPNLSPQAATRLGKLITRRRQLLSYREAHKQSLDIAGVRPKLASVSENQPTSPVIEDDQKMTAAERSSKATSSRLALSQVASSHFTIRSKATTARPGELSFPVLQERVDMLFVPSIAESKSSMASSYAGRDLHIDIPSRPKDDNGEELESFECPYCFLTKSISNHRKWKKHVLEDLQPYVCTYGNCEFYDHFFDSRETWFKHEAQHHRIRWFCNTDNHPEYDLEDDFLLHMRLDHDQKFDKAQFGFVKSMFRQPTKSLEGICNLCHRQSKNLRSHLSRHLQQMAIFALPRVNENAGSDHAEHESRASRLHKERIDDGESSKSSPSFASVLSDQQPVPNESTSDTPDIEDEYDEGDNIADAMEDQGWDSVTDKFLKARERTYRRLRILVAEINIKDRDKIVSFIERLQGEPIVTVGYRDRAADAVRQQTTPDAIIIGDVFGQTVLSTSVHQIRDVTDVPIIIVRKSASAHSQLLDIPDWIELVNPSQSDIEEALGSLCQGNLEYPLNSASTASSEVSHSTQGDTAHKEHICLLNAAGDSIEEQIVQMKTASIRKSVIRHDLISEDELDANMVSREEGQVDIPLDADTETTTAVRYCGIVRLIWRRRKSSRTHRTRFYIIPDKILNYDIIMSYADSGIEHPPPITPPLRSSETRHNSGQRTSGRTSPQASHHRSSDTNNDSSETAPTQYQIRNNDHYFDNPVIPEATNPGPSAPGGSIRNHHYPHPILSNRFPVSQPTQHEISQPSPHRATATTFASINSVSDFQPDVRSDRLRIAIKWDETRFNVWLYPDGPCQAFFEEFQSHVRKRKRVLDRTITSIFFKEDEEASDEKSYEVFLDEDSLDADWKEIVKWLGRNKKKEPPHIFGTVLVDDG